MAYVDFDFVWSGKFAQLKDPTKAVLYVVTAICNRNTGEFYHSVTTISQKAGVSRRAAAYALRELESHDPPIISSEPRDGKPAIKTHLPTADFSQGGYAPHAGGYASHAGVPLHHMQGSPVENHPQTLEPSASEDLPFPPNNSLNNNRDLTTTAADRISNALIANMRKLYGNEIVDLVVVAMKSMNGEIENPNGYFRTCVQNHWVPTSKKARKHQEEQERKEAIRKRQEEKEAERQRLQNEEQERQELATFFDTLAQDQKDHILHDAAENAKATEGITERSIGFEMVLLTEQYKILRELRAAHQEPVTV